MKKRIVVLGAGFGGLTVCRALKAPDTEITLIDRQNHHLFQPLLYQVATAGLAAPDIAQPIRTILAKDRNIKIHMEAIERIDLENKYVVTDHNRFEFDYLVIALGSKTSYFGNDQWEQFAPGLKSLHDARRIRDNILKSFEQAESLTDPEEIKKLMNVVVIGGGPTGVELAGAFAELANHVLSRDFKKIDPTQAKVTLVEAAPRLLTFFSEKLSGKALTQLEALGVEVRLNTRVKDIRENVVELENERIEAKNIIWAAGVEANPLTAQLGVPLDKAGRILVEPDCSVPGHPNVFAIGDIVNLVDANEKAVPAMAPAAIQMAKCVAGTIDDELKADGATPIERKAFRYFDKGSMATIGRKKAVAASKGIEMSGWLAWLGWLFIHLLFLVGFRNKFAVLTAWVYSYFTYKRGARLIWNDLS